MLGPVAAGYSRRISAISDGTFNGERLRGRVLAGGGDWVIVRPDGAMHMDVRATLEADSGALIYMTYTGRMIPSRATTAASEAAQEPYFRSAVQFETADADLSWLNDLVAFGLGKRGAASIHYDVYELL
jgi:hypothetical protein